MRKRVTLLIVAVLAACGGPAKKPTEPATQAAAAARPLPPQIPPVEFGKIPPGKPMTSANMPYFDTVKYCEQASRDRDKISRGPHYETCIEDQRHTRLVMGQGIDAKQFKEDVIINCAKATRTAYVGMWYCMNGQDFH